MTSSETPRCYRFADLTIEIGSRIVMRDQDTIELGKLTFDFLRALVEASPNIVTHDELAERVWGGRSVSAETISQRVSILRSTLADDTDHPRYIATMRGQGFKLIPEAVQVRTRRALFGERLSIAVVVGLSMLIVAGSISYLTLGRDESTRLPNSVAVLPFSDLSSAPEDAYFSAGVHEEIIVQLTRIRSLNIIAGASVTQYSSTEKSLSEIAEELNVETVMQGSVRYAENRVRIVVQLIDPRTSTNLWGNTYERAFDDIFLIQVDIATNIASALEIEFSSEEQEIIGHATTNSVPAYALYLRALTSPSISGIADLDRATELDPSFAAAYGLKAFLLTERGRFDPAVDVENERLAREAIANALALERNLASAHAALGALHAADWRWAEAERAFKTAYESSPNDPSILVAYGNFRRDVGQYSEAVRLAERAAELSPNVSPNNLGISYRYTKDYDAAIASFRQAISRNPANSGSYTHIAITEILRGNHDEALRNLSIAEQLWNDSVTSIRIAQHALAYSQLDRPQDVEKHLNELQRRASADDVSVGQNAWAMIYLALGDYDQALLRVKTLIYDHTTGYAGLGQIKANTYYIPVLETARWRDVREELGTL